MTAAVLDTNVLASGFLGVLLDNSTPGERLRRWYRQDFRLIISEPLLAEPARTFEEPYFTRRLSASERAADVALLRHEATLTPITITVQGVATHPQDDIVLATAVSGNADVLVTGDMPFRRRVPRYRGIPLHSPREFLTLLQAEQEGHLP